MDEEYAQSTACIFNNCSETCRGLLTCFMQHNHGPPTAFYFLTCRSNERFKNTFLQSSTDFQRKKRYSGNFCTYSHATVKTEHHKWYCSTSTFNARSLSNGQIITLEGTEQSQEWDRYFICYSAELCTSGKSLSLSICLYLGNAPQPLRPASCCKGSSLCAHGHSKP